MNRRAASRRRSQNVPATTVALLLAAVVVYAQERPVQELPVEPRHFRQPSTPLFSDATLDAGISFLHTGLGLADKFQGTGAAWIDFDNDGDQDLYITRRVGANVLYRNLGNGSFAPVAGAAGAADAARDGAGVACADYDGDGWPDMYLANSDGDVLLRNTGGTFVDATASAGLAVTGASRGTSVAWGDFDNDGWLDLYVANHQAMSRESDLQQDWLFRNQGDGTFENVSSMIDPDLRSGYGFIGAWTDVDEDGDLDIFLVNDCPLGPQSARLFRNDGPGDDDYWRFTDVSTEWRCGRCDAGMGLAIGDYNRDGRMDYFYTNIGDPVLLANRGDTFEGVTSLAGIHVGYLPGRAVLRWSWGANFFDYDLDGWQDLYVASGGFRVISSVEPHANLLFRNAGDGTFEDVSAQSGAADIDRSRTSIVADYDNDGDVDIFVVNYEEPARLYRNENKNAMGWLTLWLEGVQSNRDGIGARIRVRTPDGLLQYAELRSGSSLGGGDDLRAHFGLGANDVASEILIRWPSGIVQALDDVEANQQIRVVESSAATPPAVVNLSAHATGGTPTVRWLADREEGVGHYIVEHDDAGAWMELGRVPGQGTTIRPQSYEFVFTPLQWGEHQIRLAVEHIDGSGAIFGPVTVTVAPDSPPPGAVLSSASLNVSGSNPFPDRTEVSLYLPGPERVTVEVFDVIGRRVSVLFDATPADAITRLTVDGATWPSGAYWVRARGETFSTSTRIALIR